MTTNDLTAAQSKALLALRDAQRSKPQSFNTAAALGASGVSLTALVRKGLARTNSTRRSSLFGETVEYRITNEGLAAARSL